MKKVLHVITRSDLAGGQKVLYSIVHGFEQYFKTDYQIELAFGLKGGITI